MPSAGNSLHYRQLPLIAQSCEIEYSRQSHLKPFFNLLQHALIVFAADERDAETLGAETTSTPHAMQVRVCIAREIVVYGEVDTLDVNTTAEDVGGDANALVELLEFFVAFDAVRGENT